MEIDLNKLPLDVDFHPLNDVVAAGLITGHLLLYRYAADSPPVRLLEVDAHTEACRAVRFANEGRVIVTGSPDCSILASDTETGVPITRIENCHGAAVNRIVNLTESTVASGDDEGCVKVWDTRQRTCRNSFHVHEEYISDMTYASDSMTLLVTSGDGTLSVCDLRSNKVLTRSEFSEDELLSVVIMKNGRNVVSGTQTGNLLLYSWGFFKDCSDRFVDLSPNSVDVLLKLDEDRVITGSENGIISLVGILPNRVIHRIAEHSEYPVERLAVSHDRKYLGSISHDQTLKLWNLDDLLQDSGNSAHNHSATAGRDNGGMDIEDIILKSSKVMKEEEEEINRCQIQEWYPIFKSVSIKSVIHDLPESFVDYLLDDSGPFLLPVSISNDDALPNRVHNPEDEDDFVVSEGSDDEAEQPIAAPCFPELEMEVKASIESLGGAVFPKLNWSAPKDSSWISPTGSLRCTTFNEIALLLKSSDSLVNDLCHAYDSCGDESASRPARFVLALRKWYPSMLPEMEFRCFVCNNALVGICQREVTNFYPTLLERKSDLKMMVQRFFIEKVRENFESKNYTFDVYITRDERVKLLDFNPWGAFTLPLLFTWEELNENLKEEDHDLEFRVVESRLSIRPGLKTAVPYDYLDTSPGSGWDQFLRNADEESRWHSSDPTIHR